MGEELKPHELDQIKQALSRLEDVEVPASARQRFLSGLQEAEQAKGAMETLRVMELKARFALEDAVRGLRYALRAPSFAYARIAALVFIAVSVYAYAYMPQAPMIHDIRGTVKIFDPGKNEWRFASEKMRLARNDIVKTFGDGRADISLADVYSMRLKKDSEMRVASLSSRSGHGPIAFEVSKGTVLTYYAGNYRGSGKAMKIETEELVATALGTNFMVESMPLAHKSWVGVLDGVVQVRSTSIPAGISPQEATVLVKSSYKTEVSAGQVPEKPEPMMEDEWLQLEELYSVGKKPQVALLISTGPSRTRELLSMAPLYISDREPSPLPEKLSKAAKTFNQAVREKSVAKHAETIRIFEDIVENHPDAKYDMPFLLFTGAYYEHLGSHEKAIGIFDKAITRYPKSPLASVARLAQGYIYEEALRDMARAKEAYLRVVSDYPQSPEVEEALAGLRRVGR